MLNDLDPGQLPPLWAAWASPGSCTLLVLELLICYVEALQTGSLHVGDRHPTQPETTGVAMEHKPSQSLFHIIGISQTEVWWN